MRLQRNSNNNNNQVSSSSNGDRFGNHSRTEVTRLIIQALHEMGYENAAQELEQDSGLSIESHQVSKFRKAILSGDWNSAESLVDELQLEGDGDKIIVQFLIKRQKFLEYLEKKRIREAVNVLRQEITPMDYDTNQVHELSRLLMCQTLESICEKTNGWDGLNGESRRLLLEKLETFISPAMMIPYQRLATLLTQAQQEQVSKCVYHTGIGNNTLYTDHKCDAALFPSKTIEILREHSDEVWIVKFSHDGKKLATGSRDHTAIIWQVSTWKVLHVLRGHIASVPFLDWSYDDLHLVTCGSEKVGKNMVKIWDTTSGECILTLDSHTDEISACLFLPGPKKEFISADVDGTIILWSFQGKEIYRWLSRRVYGIGISNDGKYMITITEYKKLEKNINMYNLETKQPLVEIEINRNITSVVFSKDSKYALFNVSHPSKNNNNYNEESDNTNNNNNNNANANNNNNNKNISSETATIDNLEEIHLWDVDKVRLVRKYFGQRQGDFVIRSCFGGPNDNFIISGSEDSKVYIWNRWSGNLINVLNGHSSTVNSVDWCGGNGGPLIASASDDYTVRIWGGSR